MHVLKTSAIAIALWMLNLLGGDEMSALSMRSSDICDLDALFEGYKYCVPKKVMQDFLAGTAFGRKVAYTPDEIVRLKEDIYAIYDEIMRQNPLQEQVAVITAGSPGAGKTTLMRQHLEEASREGKKFAYVDPDDVCLKKMDKTWGKELQQELGTIADSEDRLEAEKSARKKGYEKWRPGSNAAAHITLAHLIRQKINFYLGSTSSSDLTANSFKFYKEQGYRLHLLHITAPEDVRLGSVRERDKHFVQCTEKDVKEKALLVPQRITDTYLKYADRIYFYYRTEVKAKAIHTATWIRASS